MKNTMNISCFKQYKYFILIGLILLFINSCKKDSNTADAIETATVTDVEGNIYKTIKIGNHWWMAENLKTTKYQNGDSLNFVGNINSSSILDSAKWNNIKTGAYYNIADSNDLKGNPLFQVKYGLLYNFYAISDSRNIAPLGWHVPSDDEWKELEESLGMSKTDADKVNWRGTIEGNKLKPAGTFGWAKPTSDSWFKIWGTNDYGFSAIGGGCVMFNGILGYPGKGHTGFWWSSTEYNNEAWYRYLDYHKTNVFRFYGPKTYGFSIRCVKD